MFGRLKAAKTQVVVVHQFRSLVHVHSSELGVGLGTKAAAVGRPSTGIFSAGATRRALVLIAFTLCASSQCAHAVGVNQRLETRWKRVG